jgi:hypothetical protein
MSRHFFIVIATGGWIARVHAADPWTTEWIDEIWRDYSLVRGAKAVGQGAWQEAAWRDALRADPRSARAVEQLLNYYAETGEPVLALGAALYGRLLAPDEPLWNDAIRRARDAISSASAGPSSSAEHAAYKAGLEAMLAHVLTNNLLMAEIEVRMLLTRFPRDERLIENLCTLARMSGEQAMQAMHWLTFNELNSTNLLAANNLAAVLDGIGLPGPALDALDRFLSGQKTNAYFMENAIRLAEAANRLDRAAALAAQWREANPSAAEAWLASARVALRRAAHDDARAWWREYRMRANETMARAALAEAPFREHAAALGEHPP